MEPLHEHNQKTYENICRMYDEGIQRVAVVQPTGSGKSLLMAKLIEDNPDSRFFVLSTSHKINDQFKSKLDEKMLERLECNIYCNMPSMKQEAMRSLQPDYIFLDEMHRALAKEWSKGINVLLEMYPNAKVLGLSATPIRYLDRCRNVAEELFSGNLACDMSLSEAILDGILPMARYVCGVYSYQKDAESLNKKIEKSCNSEEEKKELLKELKVLKENLDKGNGVSDIFRKYVSGNEKFVVFLKDVMHLRVMKPVIEKWFIDAGFNVRLYEVHSKNAEKDKEFKAFKEDTEDGIVKLCLSVNMVTEGIHGDVSGVIMLRETISPNMYFQMIGRAFSCGKKTIPLIFDLVANSQFISDTADNFPNELRGEIKKRKEDCEKEGKEYEVGFDIDEFIVMDYFMDVISEFKAIEERLEGSWENGLKHFDKYVIEHDGDVLVPAKYRDEDGFLTGGWVSDRRKEFKTEKMDANRIAELNIRGFVWNTLEFNFENNIQALKQYKEKEGNCLVPKNHIEVVNEKEINLWLWCRNLRMGKKGKQRCLLSKERIEQLESLGFIWDIKEIDDQKWEENFKRLCKYKDEHGHLFQIKDKELSKWCTIQRQKMRKSKMTNEYNPLEKWKIDKLNSIGFCWESLDEAFLYQLEELKKYYETHNKFILIKRSENKKLSIWCTKIRDDMRNGRLDEWKIEKLNEINFPFDPNRTYFEAGCRYYSDYKRENGEISIPKGYKTIDGFNLDSWVSSQKNKYRKNKLSDYEKDRLNEIDFCFSTNNDNFDKDFELLKEYMKVNHCNSNISQTTIYKGKALGIFVSRMRTNYKNKSISNYRKDKLQSIGFIWDAKDQQWNDNLEWFKKNKDNHEGKICISKSDIGVKYYYDWLVTQKLSYRKGEMREDRRKVFEQVVMS